MASAGCVRVLDGMWFQRVYLFTWLGLARYSTRLHSIIKCYNSRIFIL